MLVMVARVRSSGVGGSSGRSSALKAFSKPFAATMSASVSAPKSSSRIPASARTDILACLLDADLPRDVDGVRLEVERVIDAEHRVVRVGVVGADIDNVGPFVKRAQHV